jgi:NADPH2:quinone reductase
MLLATALRVLKTAFAATTAEKPVKLWIANASTMNARAKVQSPKSSKDKRMKAIQIEQPGDSTVLKLQDLPKPVPAAGQALVRLHAAGLNFIDIYRRRGHYPVKLPYTPGLEGAGIVDSVGDGVTVVKPGDRVAYTGQPGAYAEYSVVDAQSLIPIPEDLSWEQAAAFPLQGMTAHYLINEYRVPKKGDTVLIHAAAGGMGLLLVQWAKHLGARVLGTVSSAEKAAMAKQNGADEVILYTETNFVDEVKRLTDGKGAHLTIDGVGKTTFTANLDAAAKRGTIVIFGQASGLAEPLAPNDLQKKSLTVSGGSLFNYLDTREELLMRANDVLEGIRKGWLKLNIGKVFPLEQAKEAHEALESRNSIGKIILTID